MQNSSHRKAAARAAGGVAGSVVSIGALPPAIKSKEAYQKAQETPEVKEEKKEEKKKPPQQEYATGIPGAQQGKHSRRARIRHDNRHSAVRKRQRYFYKERPEFMQIYRQLTARAAN